MRATQLAQRAIKTGDFAPTYRLLMDDRVISAKLFDGTVTYSADGTSELSLNTDMNLERYVGAKVVLEIGYGDEKWPYFGGWLEEPEDTHWGGPSTALAYGPFKELSKISLDDDITYASSTLGNAIADMHRRAGRAIAGSTYEIRGNPSFELAGEEAGLAISTTFADGIGALLDLADWVSVDRPGFVRRYRAQPRPYPSADAAATYSEAHYPREAFKAQRSELFGSVGAFKRLEEGDLDWVVSVKVDQSTRFPVSPLKTYWLEDYAGDEADAWQECAELAKMMSGGVYSWSLDGISANPDLELHEVIHVHTTELRDEGGRFKERYHVRYACALDTETSVNIAREGNPMSVSGGTSIKLSEQRLPQPFAVSRLSSAVTR